MLSNSLDSGYVFNERATSFDDEIQQWRLAVRVAACVLRMQSLPLNPDNMSAFHAKASMNL